MREIRLSGSEGGGTGNSTGPPYPYHPHGCTCRTRGCLAVQPFPFIKPPLPLFVKPGAIRAPAGHFCAGFCQIQQKCIKCLIKTLPFFIFFFCFKLLYKKLFFGTPLE